MLRAFKAQPVALKLLWLGLLFAFGYMLWGMEPYRAMVIGMAIPAISNGAAMAYGDRSIPTAVAAVVAYAVLAVCLFLANVV